MIKKLEKFFQKDKNIFEIPKSVQDVIPIKTIYRDGIFLVDKNKYSKTFKFTDINFAAASKDDKESMFIKYSELINSLDPSVDSKITILNRRLNKIDYDNNIKIKEANDGLDELRKEYNEVLLTKALDTKSIIQEKFLTITINKKDIDEARSYFTRIGAELRNHFNFMGSKCIELDATDRLRIAHSFYRSDEENIFNFDMLDNMRKGHSFKDYICPDNFTFQKDYFEMGNKFGRVLFLKDYANYIRDDFISELTELNKNLILSIDIEPIPMDVAVKMVENIRLGNETNITNWQRKQNNNNNFSAVIPYDMDMQRKEITELLEDLTTRDQRLFFSLLTILLVADTKEELENSVMEDEIAHAKKNYAPQKGPELVKNLLEDEEFDVKTYNFFLDYIEKFKEFPLASKIKLVLSYITEVNPHTKRDIYTNKDKNILLRTWKEEYDKALQHYNEKIKLEMEKKKKDQKKKTRIYGRNCRKNRRTK